MKDFIKDVSGEFIRGAGPARLVAKVHLFSRTGHQIKNLLINEFPNFLHSRMIISDHLGKIKQFPRVSE